MDFNNLISYMGISERYAQLQIYICKEKIARYKAGIQSLAKFQPDCDLGQLAVTYKELDVSCQIEFARIMDLDAEVCMRLRMNIT